MKRIVLSLLAPLCSSALVAQVSAAASPTPAPAKAAPDAGQRAPGRDPNFAFVNIDALVNALPHAKQTEVKLEEEKSAAKKEYESRIAEYQKQQGELTGMNQRLAAMKEGDPARAQLAQERDAKANLLNTKEREINEFRQQRERDVQQKMATLRDPLIADIKGAANRMGQNVNLILDTSGRSLSGIPFVVLHPVGADVTQRLAPALQGKDPGSANSVRGLKVATVDMNKVFTQLKRTKEAETKINASRAAAQQENERRSNAVKDEIAKADTLTGAEKEKQLSKARILEAELNDFRSKKTIELNQEMVKFGQPILAEMAAALGRMGGDKVALVFDSTGMSNAGIPLLIWSQGLPDLSEDLIALLNGDAKAAGRTAGVSSTNLRFGLVDVERAYNALPEANQAEKEINETVQQAIAQSATVTPQAAAERQQQVQNLAREKRQAVLNKLLAALKTVSAAGDFNAVFDSSGKTLSHTRPVVVARDVPDLTDEVLAKASAPAQ